jgi:hypothetical protein
MTSKKKKKDQTPKVSKTELKIPKALLLGHKWR